jgi:hypothetical protein
VVAASRNGVRRTNVIRTLNRKSLVHTLGVAGLGLGLLTNVVGAPSAMAQEKDSQGVVLQLLQDGKGGSSLSDDELKQLLIQLLQEKEGTPAPQGDKETVPALQGDKGARDVIVQRLQDTKGEGEQGGPADFEEKRVAAYNEFVQALADQLSIDDPDQVDAAIRIAMMSVVDSHVGDGMLTKGKAEALKALIATADVPFPMLGGFGMFGPHPGAMIIAGHGPMFGPGGEGMFPGQEGTHQWSSDQGEGARAGNGGEQQWTSAKDSKERGSRADKNAKDSKNDNSQTNEEKQG